MSSKIAEAEQHIKAAEDSLKTGLLKMRRSPDYDSAADEYAKAAAAFRAAREFKRSQQMLVKTADITANHLKNLFHAAKHLETAALLAKEVKNYEEAAEWLAKAGRMLRENGNPDSASLMLEKGAKMLEEPLPEASARLYSDSAEAADIEDKVGQAAQCLGHACRMLIRAGKLDAAADVARRRVGQAGRDSNPDTLCASPSGGGARRGDLVAARKAFNDSVHVSSFQTGDDCGPLQTLLEACEQMDGDRGRQALQNPVFRYMDNEFAKLARSIRLPEARQKPSAAGGAAAEAAGAGAEDAEEFDGGLC
uniref:Gamma-soluble NSF attachment protein n=1 Tax=Macrostomum lignano TaxID=282301 RepID=A0A1I8GFZ2_9PLAT